MSDLIKYEPPPALDPSVQKAVNYMENSVRPLVAALNYTVLKRTGSNLTQVFSEVTVHKPADYVSLEFTVKKVV